MDKPTSDFQVWWDHSEMRLTIRNTFCLRLLSSNWFSCLWLHYLSFIQELGWNMEMNVTSIMQKSHMPCEISFAGGSIFANLTLKWFLACMRSDVLPDMKWWHHDFRTKWTSPRTISKFDWVILQNGWFSKIKQNSLGTSSIDGIFSFYTWMIS